MVADVMNLEQRILRKILPFISMRTQKRIDDESDPFIAESKTLTDGDHGYSLTNIIVAWLTAFFFALAFLYVVRRECGCSLGSFADDWETDFGPAKSQVEIEQISFTGGPAWRNSNTSPYSFKDNNSMYLPHPDPIDYNSGSSDAHQAWEELIGGRYFLITDEEAFNAWGEGYTEFWVDAAGGYIAGQVLVKLMEKNMTDNMLWLSRLDMMHTLHCVNMITSMTPDGLKLAESSHDRRIHYHHCLSQIRQYVMCAGDLTPIPTRYFNALGGNYVDSDLPRHTCRNFRKIRDWVWERYNGSLAVAPRQRP